MPGGDRTGPLGLGPMTGRGAGYCAGYQMPGFANAILGRGFGGWGRGGGRDRRNCFYATGLPGWQRTATGFHAYGPAAAPYADTYAGVPFAPTLTKEQELETLQSQAKCFGVALQDIKRRIEGLQAEAK